MPSTRFTAAFLIFLGAPLCAQTPAPVTVRTNQSLVGATIGNGRVQGQSAVDVQSSGRPAVGVGALSGKVDHFGSAGTVSVANNARLVGVDGAGGVHSPNSISIANPRQAPILSGRP